MNAQTFLTMNQIVATSAYTFANSVREVKDLTSRDFVTVQKITEQLFTDDVKEYEVWSAAEQDSFCSSPWDTLVASAEEYALVALSNVLETDEFQIDVSETTYHDIAKFMICARESGVTKEMFRKHLSFLSRGNEEVEYMIENLI